MAVRCGRNHLHDSVADVRRCYNGEYVEDLSAAVQTLAPAYRPTERQLSFFKSLLNKANLRYQPGILTLDRRSISEVIGIVKADETAGDTRFATVEQPEYCENAHCQDKAQFRSFGDSWKDEGFWCGGHKRSIQQTDLSRTPKYGFVELGVTVSESHGEAPKPKAARFDTDSLEDGFYVMDNPAPGAPSAYDVYKVIQAVHGSGRKYAKKLNITTGEWEMARKAITKLRPSMKMDLKHALAAAKATGLNPASALYGRCFVCGRTLTDEKSIEQGIGPVCASKF